MWRELLIDSLRRPRIAARRLLDARLPASRLIEATVLVAVLGVLLASIALMASPGATELAAAFLAYPLLGVVFQIGTMAFTTFLTFRVGRLFGGTGTADGALAVVVWLNAVLLVVQVAELVVLAVYPPVGEILFAVTLVWLFWAYANFAAELHGFPNPFIVLAVTVLALIVLSLATGMLFAILGITQPGGA